MVVRRLTDEPAALATGKRSRRRKGRRKRRGLASLEAVLAAFIALPIAAFLLILAIRACRNLFQTNGLLIGMPYM